MAPCNGRWRTNSDKGVSNWLGVIFYDTCPVASLDDSAAEMVGEVTMAPSAPPPCSRKMPRRCLKTTAISCRCLGGEVVGFVETLFEVFSRNPVAKLGIRWESFKFAPFPTQLPLRPPVRHRQHALFLYDVYACNTTR